MKDVPLKMFCVNVLADVFARETGKEMTDSRILILEATIDHMMTKTT